jgi:hypothetical protein
VSDQTSSSGDPRDVETRARTAHRQASIIVGSLIASLFVYAIVVELLSRSDSLPEPLSPPEAIRWAFYAVAVAMVFMSHVVKAFMLRGFHTANVEELLARLTTANIITAAFGEVPAVLGFALYFVGRFYTDFYILSLISLYLMFRHFPRYAQWEKLIRQQGGPAT